MDNSDYTGKYATCPSCKSCGIRHRVAAQHPIGFDGPEEFMVATYRCTSCERFFASPEYQKSVTGERSSKYTLEVKVAAVNILDEMEGATLRKVSMEIYERYGIRITPSTLHDWAKQEGVR